MDRKEFRYEKNDDRYICPEGKELRYCYSTKDGSHIYQAKKEDCAHCKLRTKCTSGKTSRRIQHSIYKEEYERLEKRLKTKLGKNAMKHRKTGPEPLFGEAKENHGLSKFMTRGVSKAHKNSLMIAMVQNLKRFMKFSDKNPGKGIVEKTKQGACNKSTTFYRKISSNKLERLINIITRKLVSAF
jgi:hypothetical protein